MQKISTMQTNGKNIFQGQLTIGLDLVDRFSSYCVLNEAGEKATEAAWLDGKSVWNRQKNVESAKKLLTGIGLLMEGLEDA